ncbi:hypothetical protein GCM10027396_17460 [Insolitispirillum peregrinum]
MARPSLRRQRTLRQSLRKRLLVAALSAGLVLGPVHWATATYPVLDELGLAEAGKQLAEAKKMVEMVTQELKMLKDQLGFITEIRKFVNDTFEAIGEMGSITLPLIGLVKSRGNIKETLGCMFDPSKMIPDIDFDTVNFGNMCSTRQAYHKSLIGNPSELSSKPVAEQNKEREAIRKRRDQVHAAAAVEALSLGTVSTSEDVKNIANTVDQLEDAATGAKTMNDRLAVLIKAQIATLDAQGKLLAVQSTQLRLMGAAQLRDGVQTGFDLPTGE